jgi:hypothetical protein
VVDAGDGRTSTEASRLTGGSAVDRRRTVSKRTSWERGRIDGRDGDEVVTMGYGVEAFQGVEGCAQTQPVDLQAMRAPCRRYVQSRPRVGVVYNRWAAVQAYYQSV